MGQFFLRCGTTDGWLTSQENGVSVRLHVCTRCNRAMLAKSVELIELSLNSFCQKELYYVISQFCCRIKWGVCLKIRLLALHNVVI